MLRKHPELEIDPNDPFALDCLNRKKSAEKLTLLIESIKQPFVLSVEAPWGWGKTTFILMWKAFLEAKGHLCFHFNAWSADFVDDPLIAFIGEMKTIMDKEINKLKESTEVKKHWQEVRRIGAGVLRKTLPLAIQFATQNLISQDNIKSLASLLTEGGKEVANNIIESYEEEKHGIIEFRENLEMLAKLILEQKTYTSPIILFVDELDRCRPDFAISLLERVKHLFSVKGFAFIISVDRNQIVNSIKKLYGTGMEADGYLRRFIDTSYSLPQPNTEAFCQFLYQRFHLQEIFNMRNVEEVETQLLMKTFSNLAKAFNFSLRVQEQCFTEINLILRTTPSWINIYPQLLPFLVALKSHDHTIYQELKAKQVNIKKVLDILSNINDRSLDACIEATLLTGYYTAEQQKEKLVALEEMAKEIEHPDRASAKEKLKVFRYLLNNGHLDIIKDTISQIDLADDFKYLNPTG